MVCGKKRRSFANEQQSHQTEQMTNRRTVCLQIGGAGADHCISICFKISVPHHSSVATAGDVVVGVL